MSTIATIDSTDLISASRTDINNNFTALNADKIETSVIDTDTALSANSDSKIPSQKAVKTYVDALGDVSSQIQDATVNAGATLNGATLPVPVYQNKTDNELYACDANDTNAYKFIGFVTSNSTDGNPITLQTAGIVSGFTGLAEGEKYYVQDTAGTIGTTPGTQEILVGVAISQTKLIIQKGGRFAKGQLTDLASTSSTAVTLGFRPSLIHLIGRSGFNGTPATFMATLDAVWVYDNLTANAVLYNEGSLSVVVRTADLFDTSNANYLTFSITSVTDTGFTISYTETGTVTNLNTLTWIAYGHQ